MKEDLQVGNTIDWSKETEHEQATELVATNFLGYDDLLIFNVQPGQGLSVIKSPGADKQSDTQ